MSPRVDDLVTDRIGRTYLKRDGWWAQLVLDEFDFLLGLGFKLTGSGMAGIHFHQKGHYIWFDGPRRDVAIDYDPELERMGASVVEHRGLEDVGPAFLDLDGLIAQHDPAARRPSRSPFNRAAVEDNVRFWAAGLREIAPAEL